MFRTIQAMAAGAAMICLTFPALGARLSGGEAAALVDDPDRDTTPLVEARDISDFSPADDEFAFVWSSDLSLTPPPHLAARDSHVVPPSATATVIPLPPAAWTGFASLTGLGAIAVLRRLRRLR